MTELAHIENYKLREKTMKSIFHYIGVYYNRARRHSAVGPIAPLAFEMKQKNIA